MNTLGSEQRRISRLPVAWQETGEPGNLSEPKPEAPSPAPPKKHWCRRIVLGLVTLATLALLVGGIAWGTYRLDHTVISSATVKGRVHRLGSRLDGQVKTVEVEPGQRVVKDQVLIRLEDAHYSAAAREAQAQVQSALKRLEVEKLSIAQGRQQLTLEIEHSTTLSQAAAGDLESATSTRERWEREHDRISALLKSGVSPGVDLDNAQAQRDSARAQAKAADGRHAAAEVSRRMARVLLEGLRVREAGLEVLATEVDLARQRLAKCEADVAATVVRAPADGWVIERIVEPGGSARVGEPMISVWLGAPWIEAWVDEKQLRRIKIGSPVDVSLTAFPGILLRGDVEAIGVLADKELQAEPVPGRLHAFFVPNAMVPIRIALPGNQLRLQPGLSALVGIRHDTPGVAQKIAQGGRSFLTFLTNSLFSNCLFGTAGDQPRTELNTHEERGSRKD